MQVRSRLTGSMKSVCVRVALVALAVAVLGTRASAALIGQNFVQVTATSADGNQGSWALPIPANWHFPASGEWKWNLKTPVTITDLDTGAPMATLNTMSLDFVDDPAVEVNFQVTSTNAATHFQISSATNSFAPITNGAAFATAAVTITDNDSNGATLAGTIAGNAYRATVNNATDFTHLIAPVTALQDSSGVGIGRFPAAGRQTIAGPISSISASFEFDLGAMDSASGTSRFDVTPEPASLSVLALGALVMVRRRR